MKTFVDQFLLPAVAVVLVVTSWVNLREAQLLRFDRSLRVAQISASQLPNLIDRSYQVAGRKERVRLAGLKAPILAVYFVKANDCVGVMDEVEDLKRKFGSTIDVAVFALGFNEDERGQLARLFTGEQIVLECEECKDFVSMKLPSSPHRLVIDRTPLKILMEERPGITSEERGALLVKLERILRQRGYRTPAA